jgi:hypothetical protein
MLTVSIGAVDAMIWFMHAAITVAGMFNAAKMPCVNILRMVRKFAYRVIITCFSNVRAVTLLKTSRLGGTLKTAFCAKVVLTPLTLYAGNVVTRIRGRVLTGISRIRFVIVVMIVSKRGMFAPGLNSLACTPE